MTTYLLTYTTPGDTIFPLKRRFSISNYTLESQGPDRPVR